MILHSSPPFSLVIIFVLDCLLALFSSNLSLFAFKPSNLNHELHASVYFKPTTFLLLLLLLTLMALITLPPSSKLNPPFLLKTRNPTKPISKFNNPTISTPKTKDPFHHFKLSSLKPHQNHLNKKWVFSCSAALQNEAELRPFSHKILLSDVVVKEPKRVFGVERNWNVLDSATLSVVVAMHLLALFAPFNFNWGALWVALGLYVATGLFGICLSFHRNLSHRSFKLPKWLEYLCAYCGVLALQGNPIDWVSTHRYHHQYCDSEKDPHSPLEGFWFSHMNWLFDTTTILQRYGEPSNVADLEKQTFYRLMKSTYVLHPLTLGALLYAFGGFPFIVWGMGVRTIWVYHITWLVNSACHVWGNQAWNTGDLSRNNWWVALLSFGEGWHNNHHAFEYSARHGLEWWQIDATWYAVRLLQAVGLARDVKLPTEAHKQKMAFKG